LLLVFINNEESYYTYLVTAFPSIVLPFVIVFIPKTNLESQEIFLIYYCILLSNITEVHKSVLLQNCHLKVTSLTTSALWIPNSAFTGGCSNLIL
jgi:hypothetical protein